MYARNKRLRNGRMYVWRASHSGMDNGRRIDADGNATPVVNLWVARPRTKPHESAPRSTKDQTGDTPPRCPHQLGPPSQQSNSKLDPPALRERTHTTSSRCARDDNFVVACVAPAVETSLRARVWAQLECHGREEISVRRFGRCKSCSSKVSKETTRVHPRN